MIAEGDGTKPDDLIRIDWTVYGKIASIDKADGTGIAYFYDAGGNRIQKWVNSKEYFYVRDAQGNVMGTYVYNGNTFTWTEQHLYGSSRLGMVTPELSIQRSTPLANANYNPTGDPVTNGTEGKRIYELSNHLGNVMVTISDRKIGVDEDNDTVTDYYTAEVLTAQDYYAFGMLMPGRQYSNAGAKYKYGFNGKENDNEVKGDGNQQDYGMRIYDPRLGRFLSVDPLTKGYPMLTPYQFASNTPIQAIDLDGGEGIINTIKVNNQPVVDVVTYHVVIATTNQANGANNAFFTGVNYENTEAFRTEISTMLNSSYNQNKTLSDVVTNPNAVNGQVPVFFNFVVSTFNADNMKSSQMNRQLFNNPALAFVDSDLKFAEDDGDVNNFAILQNKSLVGNKVGGFGRSIVDIDTKHFNDRNVSPEAYQNVENTVAHEIGHGLMRRHPNIDVRNPDRNSEMGPFNHNFTPGLGGIMRYGIIQNTINGGQMLLIPPTKNVTQTNVEAIIQSATKGADININLPIIK
ncbi:MAG: hypothetical protein KF862_23820 [Chitinophagaceae bacterium]|nr:hypothetical protein [Chitinophagaceae bacterium]